MKTILFQGDSITDAGRSREYDDWTGMGYPRLVSARLGFEFPEEYRFINKGISGNRVVDLLARVKCDMINLSPDIMSILIGINDVWHEFGENRNGICAERFEVLYDMLLEQVKEALPNIKLMLLEPFVLCGPATEASWDEFRSEAEKRAAVTRRVAEKHGALFIPLQDKFDKAAQSAPATYWLSDGVHPTAAGHELIARAWTEAFDTIK